MMRTKLKVDFVTKRTSKNEAGEEVTTCEDVQLSAVSKPDGYPDDGSDEDNSFARWTPTADFKMSITNPDLFGKLAEGQKFYVDFTPAE